MIKRKFGRWKVISEIDITFVYCKCVCGNERKVRRHNLLNGSSNSCGCLAKEQRIKRNTDRKNSTSVEDRRIKYLFAQYKSHAKYNKREFTLTIDEFKNLVYSNCHYCDEPPSNLVKNPRYGGPFYYNGIDRKDALRYYTLDNSLPCCITCNRAKNNMSYKEFIDWINRLKTKFVKTKLID